jgi:hypothetical protein
MTTKKQSQPEQQGNGRSPLGMTTKIQRQKQIPFGDDNQKAKTTGTAKAEAKCGGL